MNICSTCSSGPWWPVRSASDLGQPLAAWVGRGIRRLFAVPVLVLSTQVLTGLPEGDMTEPRCALTLGVGSVPCATCLWVRLLKKQGLPRTH
jgi:hypothetical protein